MIPLKLLCWLGFHDFRCFRIGKITARWNCSHCSKFVILPILAIPIPPVKPPRIDRPNRHRQALAEIASTSPVHRTKPDGIDERCIMCQALIDRAREALGHQPWPAPAGTKVEP